MAFELLFLGTGTSAGVPMIGCHCAVCQSTDPRDKRSRASVLIRYDDPGSSPGRSAGSDNAGDDGEAHCEGSSPSGSALRCASRLNGGTSGGGGQYLIDTTPELRQQAIRHSIDYLDGVFFTHGHADHIFGLDDLRRYNAVMKAPLDIYAEPSVLEQFGRMFGYIFEPHKNVNASFVATLVRRPVVVEQPLELGGATWTPIRLMHGRLPIVGYRVDYDGHSLAYCTDVSAVPPESFPLLKGLDVLVLDGLRYRHHPTHLTVDQALAIIDQLTPAPGRAYLTHIAHDIDHADLSARLPDGVALAYDGLSVELGQPPQTKPQRHRDAEKITEKR